MLGRYVAGPLFLSAILVMAGSMAVPLASASSGPCPNEALRSELRSGQLPDCRAYELVSPPYKQGAFVNSAFAGSRNGEHVIVGSLGAFAGAKEAVPLTDGPVGGIAYELSRTEGKGWAPTSLVPSASTYVSDGMVDVSAELESSLWELAHLQPEGVTAFYRELPVGTFTKVGRATPSLTAINKAEYDYLGASADLSHVLFSVEPPGLRWPFDETAAGSGTLYEYVGVEQPSEKSEREPTLVGVSGGRGSTALISRCGTRLGSTSPEENLVGSTYNAVSETGNRVFFTAVGSDDRECLGGPPAAPPADELFAREETPPSEGPPAEMTTVPISCSQTLPRCADANFEGASLDGSKVFFTSTQKLVEGAAEDAAIGDSATVGGCAQTAPANSGCNLYEDELSGSGQALTQKLVLVSGGSPEPRVQGVARISEDGSHVYFVAKGVLTEALNGSRAVADADNLYVYERDAQFPDGRTSFVATLAEGDSNDWSRADERPVVTSRDGRFLVFDSEADLTNEGLAGNSQQVFQYDSVTGVLVRASIGQDGYNNDDRTPEEGSEILNGFRSGRSYAHVDSPPSANGVQAAEDGAVFFESAEALTPQALNDRVDSLGQPIPNVYEYHEGNVYLISDGRDTSTVDAGPGTYLAGSDPSGEDVFFFTSDPLVPQDGDTQQDLYDARVGGGSPPPAAPAACTGEACLGLWPGPPAWAPLGGSATQAPKRKARLRSPRRHRSRPR